MTNPETHGNRIEKDFLGEVSIPAQSYYGVHTVRARENFDISGRTLREFYDLITALGMVKLACANANLKLGLLDERVHGAIAVACQDVIDGRLLDEFVVDVMQGGAGTSSNMNANEVIANRALEILGLEKGRYDVVHPNDHVNLSQSTNDVYPTSMKLALRFSLQRLKDEFLLLLAALGDKACQFTSILKVGRTQLQDAVPMTLGQEFHAFEATLREEINQLDETLNLCLKVNLGGTAIGTGINTHPEYSELAVAELRGISGFNFSLAENLIEATWDTGAFLSLSGQLKKIATKLSKICNDLRLMASGPIAGFGEINLPAMQAGSSIMPGKVNPVIPEAVNQVCFAVIGNDLTVTMASEAAQFQLNAFEPIILVKLFESVRYTSNAIRMLREKCIDGIEANEENCRRQVETSFCMATALVPVIGYEKVSYLVKRSLAENIRFVDLLRDEGILDSGDILSQLNIAELVSPNIGN